MKTEEVFEKTENAPLVVSRLHDGLLITEEEKQKMEILQPTEMKAAIYELMAKKHSTLASKIFLTIRSVNDNCDEAEDNNSSFPNAKEKKTIFMRLFGFLKQLAAFCLSIRSGIFKDESGNKCLQKQLQNPMAIISVVRNVFHFLEVDDLKNCHAVCQKWNLVAEPILRKKSRISFGRCQKNVQHPEYFLETFHHFAECENYLLPFTSFRFEGQMEWPVSVLKKFFDHQKKNIKDLELKDIGILTEDGDWENEYDIDDWLTNSAVSQLVIRCNRFVKDKTVLTFSWNTLSSIPHIQLFQCRLDVGNGRRIAPIAIDLSKMKFTENGEFISEYCLNNLIDFSKAKHIRIYGGCDYVGLLYTNPIFDLSRCLDLNTDCIKLYNIKVINWGKAKGTVESMFLRQIPFVVKTTMNIKKLDFWNSSIDLSALPLSIQQIYLGSSDSDTQISCSQPISLPNLNFCKIYDSKLFKTLNFFDKCSHLEEIDIDCSHDKDKSPLNLKSIPRSIKIMKIGGVDQIISEPNETLKLEKLVLEKYSLETAAKVIKQIVPDILVLQWEKEFETSGNVLLFLQKFQEMVSYIGPFIWNDKFDVFETSPLFDHVDKKATCYVFENNQGKSIKPEEFENIKAKMNCNTT